MFMSYIVYSGHHDLREAIRPYFEADGYRFVWADTPEAAEAIAEAEGEYVTIDYTGGDTATVAEIPHLDPSAISIPRKKNGEIHASLSRELIRSYIEAEPASYVAELEARAARLRDTDSQKG